LSAAGEHNVTVGIMDWYVQQQNGTELKKLLVSTQLSKIPQTRHVHKDKYTHICTHITHMPRETTRMQHR